MPRTKKKTKPIKEEPKKLSTQEALAAEERVQKIERLHDKTALFKTEMENLELRTKIFELQSEIGKLQLSKKKLELREHGQKVMLAESSSLEYLNGLKEKYGVSKLVYDPLTLEIEET